MKAIRNDNVTIDLFGINEEDALTLASFIYFHIGGPSRGPRGSFERLYLALRDGLTKGELSGEERVEARGQSEFTCEGKGQNQNLYFLDTNE